MKISGHDLQRIRWSLLFLVLVTLFAIGISRSATKLVAKAESTQKDLLIKQRAVRSSLSQAPEEVKELRSKIALFQDLERRGIIGQEERLNWVEQIGRIKAARRLFDIQYEIAPQRLLDDGTLPGGPVAGNYQFMASAMNFQMPLLHEGDLIGFLDDLRATIHAHILVRNCTIDRAPPTGDGRLTPQLRATCALDWVTLREIRQ